MSLATTFTGALTDFGETVAEMLTTSCLIFGVTTCDKNLQKGVKNTVLSVRKYKIRKNHHEMVNELVGKYVQFEVATISC